MFKKKALLGAAMLLGLATVPANATLITFEDLSNGNVVTNQYAGVVFSTVAGQQNVITTQPGIGFGDDFLCTAATGGGLNCANETTLTFTSLVNNLSFYQVGDNFSGVGALVDVFTNGAFSATVNILSFNNFNIPDLVDLTAFTNVSSIRIHSIVDPGGLGWDNFSFEAARTPEIPVPAALPLLASGLGALGFAGWRRKRKAVAA
jgi:hypothetical protein